MSPRGKEDREKRGLSALCYYWRGRKLEYGNGEGRQWLRSQRTLEQLQVAGGRRARRITTTEFAPTLAYGFYHLGRTSHFAGQQQQEKETHQTFTNGSQPRLPRTLNPQTGQMRGPRMTWDVPIHPMHQASMGQAWSQFYLSQRAVAGIKAAWLHSVLETRGDARRFVDWCRFGTCDKETVVRRKSWSQACPEPSPGLHKVLIFLQH